jgi:hypothetical protein
MPNQDLRFNIHRSQFNAFSIALTAFNRRTDKVNAELKKAKYARVNRFPVSSKGDVTVICLGIKDRSKVLFQELIQIVNKYDLSVAPSNVSTKNPAKAVSSPIQAPSRQWGLWVPCESEEAARAAAGFLQAIAKVGQPQVECRG